DHAVVALDEGGELAGFEESCVLGVSRIVHRCSSQPGHPAILRGSKGHLARSWPRGRARRMDEEEGIYRGEVLELMGPIADSSVDVRRILWYMEGDGGEWEAEEEEEGPEGDD